MTSSTATRESTLVNLRRSAAWAARIALGLCAVGLLCSIALYAAAPSTPIADAARARDRDAVQKLLRGGADVNAAQGDGMTALHWAALNGDVELSEILLRAGATVAARTRLGGYTALALAAEAGHGAAVAALLKAGA